MQKKPARRGPTKKIQDTQKTNSKMEYIKYLIDNALMSIKHVKEGEYWQSGYKTIQVYSLYK